MNRVLQACIICITLFTTSSSALALSKCEWVCSKNHFIKKIILQKRVLEKEFSQGDQYITVIDDFIEKNSEASKRLQETQLKIESALPQLWVSAIKEALVYLYYKIDLALYNTQWNSLEINNAIMGVNYQYLINSPSSNWEYTTTEDQVSLEWYTNNPLVSKIVINDYPILSFDGNAWNYLASENFWSLSIWRNTYIIEYYDNVWEIIHTEDYIVIKASEDTIEQIDIYALDEEELYDYLQWASLEELEHITTDIHGDSAHVYQEVIKIYEVQIEKARDMSRIADLKALQAVVEQVYQDYGEFPTSQNFMERWEVYIDRIPEDTFSGYVINGCNFWFQYEVWTDDNGINNQRYRLTACFENRDNISSKAFNIYDNGVNDLAYEIGLWDKNTVFTDDFYINGINQWKEKEREAFILWNIDDLSNESKRGIFSLLIYEDYIKKSLTEE